MEHNRNFTGTINPTAAESTVAWTSDPSQLRRKPNIVLVVLDDVGYAEFGCYGSDIETPALDSLAADGLRYANFHVTPLCSPTRTCLLTGRNHHSVGMGRVAEMVNGFPNTRGFASREAANLKQIDALGKRDDTIVIAISDNGASPLGGAHGTYDHQRSRVGLRPSGPNREVLEVGLWSPSRPKHQGLRLIAFHNV